MAQKIRVGSKVVPRIGAYKGKVCVVLSSSKIVQGRRDWGTKKGQMIYWASPEGKKALQAWYRRKDLKLKPQARPVKKRRKKR